MTYTEKIMFALMALIGALVLGIIVLMICCNSAQP